MMGIVDFLKTGFWFLLAFSSLVVAHELGHFLVAKWCGVKILRFSLGWGKPLWSRRFGADQTEWAIAGWMVGGYVSMLDARVMDMSTVPESDRAREFTVQSVWKRIAIVAAGPIANFLLAIAIFTGLFVYGMSEPVTQLRAMSEASPAYQAGLRGGQTITSVDGEKVQVWSQLRKKILQATLEKKRIVLDTEIENAQTGGKELNSATLDLTNVSQADLEGDLLAKLGLEIARPPAILGKVEKDGPADLAGLRSGDLVLQVDGKPIADSQFFVEKIRNSAKQSLQIHILRKGEELDIKATPLAKQLEDKAGNSKEVGYLMVTLDGAPKMLSVSYPISTALGLAVQECWDTSIMTLKMLGKMITGQISLKNLTGPITIADYAGQTAKIGWISYLNFIAFISLSLGVMNLLPIPVLDGGHLLYYSLEILMGRPLPKKVGDLAQRAGVGILAMMMAIAFFNDIVSRLPK